MGVQGVLPRPVRHYGLERRYPDATHTLLANCHRAEKPWYVIEKVTKP